MSAIVHKLVNFTHCIFFGHVRVCKRRVSLDLKSPFFKKNNFYVNGERLITKRENESQTLQLMNFPPKPYRLYVTVTS